MTAADAHQDSDFEAAFAAGVGLTSRLLPYRTLAGNMRKRLAPGERVAGLAPTTEYPSFADHAKQDVVADDAKQDVAVRPSRLIVTTMAYFAGGFVLGAVFDISWPAIAALLAALLLFEAWSWRRRRPHGERGGQRSLRSLVLVTDRRLIEGVHPNEFRELPLERVNDVQVRTGNYGIATVRVSADAGDMDIHVVSEWPKRRAVPAARAIAEDIRRGAAARAGRGPPPGAP